MIEQSVRAEVETRLRVLEEEHSVKVLFAIESGSRAWGFPSINSDYDIRFVYIHPRDYYLDVNYEEKRDVIELPIQDDIDLNGWDARKALRLFWKSNPSFLEWIQSPIIYEESGPFLSQAREILPAIYSLESGIYHYRSMAKTNYKLAEKHGKVKIKKYLYVLRPLLCVRWIEKHSSPAPMLFSDLLHLLADEPEVKQEAERLVEIKKGLLESAEASTIPVLRDFIEGELLRLETVAPEKFERAQDVNALSQLFKRCLTEAWPH